MDVYRSKLIVLRGNSGSGKSTVAKIIREKSQRKIAIVEQDVIRREIFKEKETNDANYIELMKMICEYSLSKGFDVILEGILGSHRHLKMLKDLADGCPESYFFYFDVSFEETLKRHKTKPNAHEFGENEMREWYKERDILNFENEIVISEDISLEAAVNLIQEKTGL